MHVKHDDLSLPTETLTGRRRGLRPIRRSQLDGRLVSIAEQELARGIFISIYSIFLFYLSQPYGFGAFWIDTATRYARRELTAVVRLISVPTV